MFLDVLKGFFGGEPPVEIDRVLDAEYEPVRDALSLAGLDERKLRKMKPDGVDGVAADGADVEFAAQQVGGDVSVGDMLAVHQLHHADAQGLSQRLQQGDVRKTFGGLPLGDGLAADAQDLGEGGLGQITAFPELPDGGAGYISIHGCHFLSERSIPRKKAQGNLRFVDK